MPGALAQHRRSHRVPRLDRTLVRTALAKKSRAAAHLGLVEL